MGMTQASTKRENVRVVRSTVFRAGNGPLAAARIALGLVFVWAFLDKTLGLGFATPSARAWVAGGSPTRGYLTSSVGPFAEAFRSMAGHPFVDALFMAGLLGVGAALLLGIGVRIAGISGIAMMALMYASHPPWALATSTHPVVDSHVLNATLLLLVALHGAGSGPIARWWSSIAITRRHPTLL